MRKLCIREILVMTSAYVRPNTLCGVGGGEEGRESGVSPSGGGVYYIYLRGNRERNGMAIVVAFKNLFTLGTCFQLFHGIMIL